MWLLAPFRLIVRTLGRFHDEHCVQTAAALSFATLIGLVPMIATAFALISWFPVGVGLGSALEKFLLANLLPEKAGTIIAKYIGQFASRAGRMTVLGIVVLGATALMQMLTIERAFNHIWRVKSGVRCCDAWPCTAWRCSDRWCSCQHCRDIVRGGVSLGLVDEPRGDTSTAVLPFAFMTALFGLLYWAYPTSGSGLACGSWGAEGALGFGAEVGSLYIATGFTVNAVVYGASPQFRYFWSGSMHRM